MSRDVQKLKKATLREVKALTIVYLNDLISLGADELTVHEFADILLDNQAIAFTFIAAHFNVAESNIVLENDTHEIEVTIKPTKAEAKRQDYQLQNEASFRKDK